MKGLFVWANSYCRSTLAFYRGLGLAFDCPLKIVVLKGLSDARKKTGFGSDEFSDMDISFYQGLESASRIFDDYREYNHIFGSYQAEESVALIKLAIRKKIKYGICSEAPCNMTKYPTRILKTIYLHTVLPYKVRTIVRNADFIVNFSGDDDKYLLVNGWESKKIIPCGYYSPKIAGTQNVLRTEANWKNFSILLSGIHQWHRSPMILLEALRLLKADGLQPQCNITQEGPLLAVMKEYVEKHQLHNVRFLGFVPMNTLKNLYETCSVYVGAGNNEPWGMRLNDVLQCGTPLIVNRGMGGVKLVDDYHCGLAFKQNSAKELAAAIKKMMIDKDFYLTVAQKAYDAVPQIAPEEKTKSIVGEITKRCPVWK